MALADLPIGSTYEGGRWHLPPPVGAPVVYTASSRALCQLEKRVHCNGVAPINQILMRLELDETAAADLLDVDPLPKDWASNDALTQAEGIKWRLSNRSLGLWVPSAVEPSEKNLILNPGHPLYAGIRLVIERNPFTFDSRMF